MSETRRTFHDELDDLQREILEMGELAGTAVQEAVHASTHGDAAQAQRVIDMDDSIDHRYLDIEQRTLRTLALQTPVAADLRLISAIIHSSLHLERIGDQAVNIAKLYLISKDLAGSDTMRGQIREMGDLVVQMLRTALEAFAKRDLELALRLPTMDDPVDRLNRATHLEALKLADDPAALDWGLHMNLAARALERVGDNAVDIAEQVSFLITGEFREFTDASHEVPGVTEPQRRILLVEDEESLAESIRYSLEQDGFTVTLAADGRKAIERFRSDDPDLVILDLMLPELSGLDVCRLIREESNVPIVMVTAKDSEADKVAGLELGADDYVTKPFSIRELVSRVRAHLRRTRMQAPPAAEEMLNGGPIAMDVAKHEVRVGEGLVAFPPKEFELLEAFLRRRGRLLTREFLIEEIRATTTWGTRRPSTST